MRIKHLRGGRDGVFVFRNAREKIIQKVGHKQKSFCVFKHVIFVVFCVNKLIKRVEIKDLDTCFFVNFLCTHCVERLFLTDCIARVAVMHGIGKKRAVFVQKAVVNTPSVDSDKVKTAVVVRLNNRLFYLVQKVQNVPEKISARPNAVVLKTVNFFKRYFSAVEICDYSASA